jgi:CubicO group peptidase (beta-lactamase class C family)
MLSTVQLKRTSPEAVGIPAAAVAAFVTALEEHTHPLDAVQGFMLLRHGQGAAEGWWAPYGPQSPHTMYSLSKSFTSTAIGLAAAEGRLTVNDPVLKFFPDDTPASPSTNLKAMRVRHLLAMNTGHQADTTDRVFGSGGDNWPAAFLALPVEHAPGSWFVYNTAATYMLSAIITQLTGATLLDYLRPRLFDPLGIENPTWESDPRGINLGGTGLHIKLEDIARFGQMYLQGGAWDGTQVVPAAWIAEATAAHSDNSNTQSNPDWSVGYGYQFWRCRHNAYRGDGAFGQFCIVMPEQDAVLAMISGVRDMQVVLDKVWAHLLPAMGVQPLPADPAAHNALRVRLANLALPLAPGVPTPPDAAQWSGKVYTLADNPLGLQRVALDFAAGGSALTVADARGTRAVAVGCCDWRRGAGARLGHFDLHGAEPEAEPLAACGDWTAAATYEARICYHESELAHVLRFHFAGADLRLEIEPNVAWEDPKVTTLTGRAHA